MEIDPGRQLKMLAAVGPIFSESTVLKVAFEQVLDFLKQHYGAICGFVALLDPARQEIRIEASSGLSDVGRLARIKPWEGVTGRVIELGKPAVVPKLNREPEFLNRAGKRRLGDQEITHFCVPLIAKGNAIGAIGVDFRFQPDRDYDADLVFLGLIAVMVAQAVNAEQVVEEERSRLVDENEHLLEEVKKRYDFSNIVGSAEPMQHVFKQITQVANTNTTVLIRGESGVGKELIAHTIHYNSARANKPFIKVNCAALPETLVESELFGYEKGAFTDAQATKKGRFELAEGGTLFLDEIADMNQQTQAKLLRVLQEREFERLGSTDTIRVDVRLIAGTNKNLENAIANGRFRNDLYYRLNVFAIVVPPLRDRKSDLLPLANHFLQKNTQEQEKHIRRISTSAIEMLASYHWPGNVRELANVIEHAVLVCDGKVVHTHHLPLTLQTAQASGTVSAFSLSEVVAAFEKNILLRALRTADGNRSQAARLLGSTERIVSYKLRRYGIL